MSMQFKIGNKTIGKGKPCLIMAEVAQAHDGSLGMAHAFIDAVAAAVILQSYLDTRDLT